MYVLRRCSVSSNTYLSLDCLSPDCSDIWRYLALGKYHHPSFWSPTSETRPSPLTLSSILYVIISKFFHFYFLRISQIFSPFLSPSLLQLNFIFVEQFSVHSKIEQKHYDLPYTPCPHRGTAPTSLSTCTTKTVYLLLLMNLHWQVMITQSS